MLRHKICSDANVKEHSEKIFNIELLSVDIIPKIERDLDPCDVISLVFLLYDVPDTALQRLTVYERISRDVSNSDSNLLLDWVLYAQAQPNWKQKLLEALVTCQLYSVIRKIGLSVEAVKRYYAITKDELLNPMKKTLYRLCEHMNMENLHKLKKTLITYDIDTTDYNTCELILLHLMCQKFITVNVNHGKEDKINIENLAKIIDNFIDLQRFSYEMRQYELSMTNSSMFSHKINTENPPKQMSTDEKPSKDNNDQDNFTNFDEIFDMFNNLKLENIPDENFKSDTLHSKDSVYPIINPKSVGVCLIINQENFHPSKHSIERTSAATLLEKRTGSTKDKNALAETMKNLNFEVVIRDDLDHIAMLECIKSVLTFNVRKDHSMFMLCILSHGTKGHVYAADCVKIKVEDIEGLLDLDGAIHLQNKPKILILQACQTNDSESAYIPLVADSPKPVFKYYIKKSDIIIFWATASNYEAYRHLKMGSLFIQMLCKMIREYSKKDHVLDLFTKVNYAVKKLCNNLKCDQLPKVEFSLIKKLYLQCPEKKIY